jgi:hypothetical protein
MSWFIETGTSFTMLSGNWRHKGESMDDNTFFIVLVAICAVAMCFMAWIEKK